MEVFKYATSAQLEIIKIDGGLSPEREDGFVHGIPDDPLLLGSQTQEIMDNCQNSTEIPPVFLLKFNIKESDPSAFVQEMAEEAEFKIFTRIPLAEYRKEDFELPEVVIDRHIPFEELSTVISASAYKNVN